MDPVDLLPVARAQATQTPLGLLVLRGPRLSRTLSLVCHHHMVHHTRRTTTTLLALEAMARVMDTTAHTTDHSAPTLTIK